MIRAFQLAYSTRENIECYKAGTDAGTGLELTAFHTPKEGGKLLGVEWAIPCSTNGVALTGFDYQKATSNTKPRPDAVKVFTVLDTKNGGNWGRWIVPDTYTSDDYYGYCETCVAVASVTVIAPYLFNGECVIQPIVIPACVNNGALYVEPFTGTNNTYTATPYGFDAAGTPIVFAPGTSVGTSVALLATAMQTNWAAELGTGTFTANGNVITYTSTNGARVSFTIAQSQV